MAKDNTLELAERMSILAHKLDEARQEAESIYKAYFDTPASTVVTGLTNETDPVPGVPDVTKAEYVRGINLCQQISNFCLKDSVVFTGFLTRSRNRAYQDNNQ